MSKFDLKMSAARLAGEVLLAVSDKRSKLDANGSGFIDADDLSSLLLKLGLQKDMIPVVLAKTDAKKNRRIRIDDFVHWLFAVEKE